MKMGVKVSSHFMLPAEYKSISNKWLGVGSRRRPVKLVATQCDPSLSRQFATTLPSLYAWC